MNENRDIEEIFSRSIRAGRRTYFFDVRSTRAGDYYMTLTESKRDFNEDGTPFYKKHKIYLYKEDFKDFKAALEEVSSYIILQMSFPFFNYLLFLSWLLLNCFCGPKRY